MPITTGTRTPAGEPAGPPAGGFGILARVPITTEFWATTAQVIPALLLAVVLAERADRLSTGRALAVTTVAVSHFLFAFAVAVLPLAAAVWLAIRV
ncbi:hypothetical protein [Amycolatopsis sp. DG1A-15b]|uniref:hypothetical protein n=1 Tax=Amycolatopsis sp. DG1A-15b TaxID=3052846 RepID=UPI00255B6FBE|nr:hypothetical protein [Amycolatopsis sp. DG1A-15b]WIX90507.1 hypothetical protein QRY02_08810 [Amycolatopsis sp. DG1A-15b]